MDLAIQTVTIPSPEGGPGSVTTLTSMLLNSALGVGTGDPFAIVWFDSDLGSSTVMNFGDWFGVYTNPNLILPVDGANQPYFSNFVGPDPVRSANIPWIFPEPSSLMLSLLGVLPLLRRRR